MATKAQWHKYYAQRSGPGKKPRPKIRRDVGIDTSLPGVSATDRKAGHGSSAARNLSKRAGRRAGVVLEDSNGKASRKSTRRAKGGHKPSSTLRRVKTQHIRRKARRRRLRARRGGR